MTGVALVLAPLPHIRKVVGLIQGLGSFCVEYVSCQCACVASFWVFWLQ